MSTIKETQIANTISNKNEIGALTLPHPTLQRQ
jgi:hypothetical protein